MLRGGIVGEGLDFHQERQKRLVAKFTATQRDLTAGKTASRGPISALSIRQFFARVSTPSFAAMLAEGVRTMVSSVSSSEPLL